MAGMLPGVECARRRRFHNSYGSNLSPTTSRTSICRRPSFCSYATTHEFSPDSSMQRNSIGQNGLCDESRLGAAAREAKKRLDERLQPQWRSQTRRTSNGEHSLRSMENMPRMQPDSQAEVPKLRKNRSKSLINRLKISWKSSEQEECAVCLEQFEGGGGENLMQLGCGHRFHTKCLVPWLEGNAHCPCCRMTISS